MAIYLEKIEENNKKIAQLERNIKRDTEKRKKLLEDNRILSYNALCERYNCGTQELLDINYPPYGYMKGTDKNCTPIVDPYSSEIVRRIFEMRAAGYNVKRIVDVLNSEHILVPSDYY